MTHFSGKFRAARARCGRVRRAGNVTLRGPMVQISWDGLGRAMQGAVWMESELNVSVANG